MHALKRIIMIATATSVLASCTVQTAPVMMRPDGRPQMVNMTAEMSRNIQELTHALMALGPTIARQEAMDIAYDAYIYPLHLAKEWNLTWPPLLHNTLRNARVRPKGLCTDWASAMIEQMRKKNLSTFDIYWGVAYRGDAWREHSTLVVTAKGQPFTTGIILDPWRNSGELYWTHIGQDPSYPWTYHAGPFKPLPQRGAPVQRIVRY